MTARSLSIDSMRITPHTLRLLVLNMNLHFLLSKRITQQEYHQTGPASPSQVKPSAGPTQLSQALRMLQNRRS
jgi:hypothetical protein